MADAAQDITRGHTRVMGLAKTALMTLVAVMAVNLRLLDAWTLRQQQAAGTGTAPVRRRPRRRTQLLSVTRARVAAAQATTAAVAAHQVPDPPAQE